MRYVKVICVKYTPTTYMTSASSTIVETKGLRQEDMETTMVRSSAM